MYCVCTSADCLRLFVPCINSLCVVVYIYSLFCLYRQLVVIPVESISFAQSHDITYISTYGWNQMLYPATQYMPQGNLGSPGTCVAVCTLYSALKRGQKYPLYFVRSLIPIPCFTCM